MNYPKYLLHLSLLLFVVVVAACGSAESSANRPTEYRIVTLDSEIAQLDSPTPSTNINGASPIPLVTQAVRGTPPPPVFPTSTLSTSSQLMGKVVNGDAVLLEAPNIESDEILIVPEDTIVPITEQTTPNRIGIVFYQVEYDDEVGWIASTQLQVLVTSPSASITPQVTPTLTLSATPLSTSTPTVIPTSLPAGFPTPEVYSVVLVEQMFEHGRMIWFQPIRQIWVLIGDEVDPTSGTWECYIDDFVEGQPERDPTLDPPAGASTESLLEGAAPRQPIRGFGRVWRDNAHVRESLGWALLPETLHTTRYEYIAGGEMDGGEYEAAPGEYRVESLFQYTLVFEEDTIRASCETKTGTWEIQ